MDGGHPTQHDVIADDDVAAERRVVGEHHPVTDPAVVGDMGSDHEQPVVADFGEHPAALGAGTHGDVLADDVAVPDHKDGTRRPGI